eukprot:gnl/Chilomastix_cuspidata/1290.p1 GENE.gnl/Chilomastix_cuspidata/1290~~gnl/Chilomastix_cuspidata/1290.p1  ORF type:complete len:341 (-),score=50.48 gnl/Chilomastix_cuspidata/1290:173-1195(-)
MAEEEEEFVVTGLTDKRPADGSFEYLVRWFGYGPDADSWVKREEFTTSESCAEYEDAVAKNPKLIFVDKVCGEPLPEQSSLKNNDVCSICLKGPVGALVYCDGWCQRAFCLPCLQLARAPLNRWVCPDCRHCHARCCFCGETGLLWHASRPCPSRRNDQTRKHALFRDKMYVHQCSAPGCAAMFHFRCAQTRGLRTETYESEELGPLVRLRCSDHLCVDCGKPLALPPPVSCVVCCRGMHASCAEMSNWRVLPDSTGDCGRKLRICPNCEKKHPMIRNWPFAMKKESVTPIPKHTGPAERPRERYLHIPHRGIKRTPGRLKSTASSAGIILPSQKKPPAG